MKRPVSQTERMLITRIAEKLPEEQRRKQLLDDLANATAESAGERGSRVIFEVAGYRRPPYRGQHSFGVAGRIRDKDGAQIALDLYADENDRLLELELIREDLRELIDPEWHSLELF